MGDVYSWLFITETFSSGYDRTLVQPEDTVWVLRDWSVVLQALPAKTLTLSLNLNGGTMVSVATCASCEWEEHWQGRIVLPAYRAPDPPPVILNFQVILGGDGVGNHALSGYSLYTP